MGILNKFKKPPVEQTPKSNDIIEVAPNIIIRKTTDERVQIVYYNNIAQEGKQYDTTLLTLSQNAYNLGGERVYDAVVAWCGKDDCIRDPETAEIYGTRNDYQNIYVGIDDVQNLRDPNYCTLLMNNLLAKDRVEKYVENGLKDNPYEIYQHNRAIGPCGRYVGGVRVNNGICEKHFSPIAGRFAHELPEMLEKRAQIKMRAEQERQEKIRYKKEMIKKLEQEIDEL